MAPGSSVDRADGDRRRRLRFDYFTFGWDWWDDFGWQSTSATSTSSIPLPAEGFYSGWFYATDRAGNDGDEGYFDVAVDARPPGTACSTSGLYFESAPMSLSASDTMSGVAQTTYSVNGNRRVVGTTATLVATKPPARWGRTRSRSGPQMSPGGTSPPTPSSSR